MKPTETIRTLYCPILLRQVDQTIVVTDGLAHFYAYDTFK